MKQQHNTVTVNGQQYDKTTGLPLTSAQLARTAPSANKDKSRSTTSAPALHTAQRKSVTLRRPHVKKQPSATKKATSDIQPRKAPSSQAGASVARSASIKKFSPATPPTQSKTPDIAPRQHPHAAKAHSRTVLKKKKPAASKQPPLRERKEAAISKAIDEAKPAKPPKKQPRTLKKHVRIIRVSTIVAAGIALIAVLVWINLPKLSVTLASAQSGVSASIPHFYPDGYRLRLPISAEENKVIITFQSNQNDSSFTLTQEKSSWDSQAVRAAVEEQSEGKFLTTNDRGLTVYTFNGNATWVNRGTLYTITGDSYLSNDTILRIANSI